jgi:putative SOS response-associated peptidase YedK
VHDKRFYAKPMCNLYSMTKTQKALVDLVRAMRDLTGNLPPLSAIFPDGMAPVVINAQDGRTLLRMRWGFPPPPGMGTWPVTNVRNTKSGYWKPWLKPEQRCLVPFTSFCEYTDSTPKVPHWFAANEDRPVLCFAGIWRPWTGTRGTKKDPSTGEHMLYSFLTTEANDDVRPIHAKAMPVVLAPDEWDTWLTAPVDDALKLQRPLPNGAIRVVARGDRSDQVTQD